MAEDKSPAAVELDRKVAALEEKAKPQLEGLTDRVTGAVWDNIKDFLTLLWIGRMEDSIEYMPELIDAVTAKQAEEAEKHKEALSMSDFIARINAETEPRAIVELYEGLLDRYPVLKWIMSVIMLVSGLGMTLLAETSATKEIFWQSVWKRVRPALIPTEALVAFGFKNPDLIEEVKAELTKYGYTDELIDVLIASATEKLSPDEARAAFLRGNITEIIHDEVLKSHRLSDAAIEQRKLLYELIPPVQDLIVMAVREVFSPEIAERFGQFEDFPAEFEEVAAKIGLTSEWAKNYWAAHWSLPSVTQAFEMYHRAVISREDLEYLLRALDIMPYWRDRILAISHNPYTRVDVRRMYGLGILDEDQVLRSYLDLGYDDEKAARMTEFTIAYTADTDRELTKTDITTLYKRSGITYEVALNMLQEIGYSEESAELVLTRAALEVISDIKKQTLEATRKLYVAGKISETQVYDQLGRIDLPSEEMNQLLKVWDLDRAAKVRYLTFDQVKALYQAGIIKKDEVSRELTELGYSMQDTTWLTELITRVGVE